jgi:4-amino-4-deoxy-L-arabinose transferase-like glycosyltransferase
VLAVLVFDQPLNIRKIGRGVSARRLAMANRIVAVVILLALCALFFFYGLGTGDLYRTESLRAILAAEFLRSGNWIVPTLYGEPFFTKPPGMYAAIALASWPAGEVSAWTARLPSALAATITVFLAYWYFGRQLGWRGGMVAAMVLPLSLMWLDKASAAEIDMLLVAWVAASLLFFFRALETPDRFRWWLAAFLCVAGGVLTKWTAPVFFYATAIALLWKRGDLRLLWCRQHLLSAALGAGVCLTWIAAAVAHAGWDAFYDTVRQEALVRLSPAQHQAPLGHHRVSAGLAILAHPFRVWAASLPISAFALPALWPGFARRWDERGRRLLEALHCWIWPSLFFWSVIPEHAVRHSFPLVPGIAGLAAFVWFGWLTGKVAWRLPRLTPRAALVCVLVLWLGVKLTIVHGVIPERDRKRATRAKGEQVAACMPAGQVLYLFRLKDEGLMFYYGGPVRRLPGPDHLPFAHEPLYCILQESEWRQWPRRRSAEVIVPLRDEQGDPIVLVRVTG